MEKKYGVWAVRSAASIFGAAQSWCKENGRPIEFDTMAEAEAYAKELNETMRSANLHYYAKEKEPERQAVPSAQPENPLRAAELTEEGQTGNYNMIDGQINNEPPKPSIREHLKSEHPEQEHRQNPPTAPERER